MDLQPARRRVDRCRRAIGIFKPSNAFRVRACSFVFLILGSFRRRRRFSLEEFSLFPTGPALLEGILKQPCSANIPGLAKWFGTDLARVAGEERLATTLAKTCRLLVRIQSRSEVQVNDLNECSKVSEVRSRPRLST